MEVFTGDYADIKIRIEKGRLSFQKGTQMIYYLKPMTEDTFLVENMPYLRLRFIKENGAVAALIRVYDNGMERTSAKAK